MHTQITVKTDLLFEVPAAAAASCFFVFFFCFFSLSLGVLRSEDRRKSRVLGVLRSKDRRKSRVTC